MKTDLLPQRGKITKKAEHLDVLARLVAPKASKKIKARPTLNLALALDQSGSMAGGPFEEAKKAALALVNGLLPTDRISVVLYNGSARVALASQPATQQAKDMLAIQLASQQANGSTALHAGWLTAAQQVAPHVNEYGVSRVLLLSDGQATDGKKDPDALREESYQLLAAGISTGTYGLGMYFNEELMTKLAAGSAARFAQDALQLAPYFSADFDLLSQTVAPVVLLKVSASAKGKSISIDQVNDYPTDSDGYWRLPAAVAGAESWAALRLGLEGVDTSKGLSIHAQWKWTDLDGKLHERTQEIEIGVGAAKEDSVVMERCAEAHAARLAQQAAKQAARGDFAQASHTVGLMRSLSATNAYIGQVACNLSAMAEARDATAFSKEALYSSTSMSNRIADIGEDATLLSADRFGLRKAMQGKAVPRPSESTTKENS